MQKTPRSQVAVLGTRTAPHPRRAPCPATGAAGNGPSGPPRRDPGLVPDEPGRRWVGPHRRERRLSASLDSTSGSYPACDQRLPCLRATVSGASTPFHVEGYPVSGGPRRAPTADRSHGHWVLRSNVLPRGGVRGVSGRCTRVTANRSRVHWVLARWSSALGRGTDPGSDAPPRLACC